MVEVPLDGAVVVLFGTVSVVHDDACLSREGHWVAEVDIIL